MTTLNLTRFYKIYQFWEDNDGDLQSPLINRMWNVFIKDNPNATEWITDGQTVGAIEDLVEIAEQESVA
jgi:hypothetical protein